MNRYLNRTERFWIFFKHVQRLFTGRRSWETRPRIVPSSRRCSCELPECREFDTKSDRCYNRPDDVSRIQSKLESMKSCRREDNCKSRSETNDGESCNNTRESKRKHVRWTLEWSERGNTNFHSYDQRSKIDSSLPLNGFRGDRRPTLNDLFQFRNANWFIFQRVIAAKTIIISIKLLLI